MAGGDDSFFEIDTKGVCLLCLKRCPPPQNVEAKKGHQTAFKLLMRYLKVDIFQFANFSSTHLELADGLESVPIVVSLCPGCSTITNEFGELFDGLEYVRLQLDKRAQALHKLMEEGDRDVRRVVEFRGRMRTRNPLDLINLSIVEKFRKETIQKCSQKLDEQIPKVVVTKERKEDIEILKKAFPITVSRTQPTYNRPGPKSKKKTKKVATKKTVSRADSKTNRNVNDNDDELAMEVSELASVKVEVCLNDGDAPVATAAAPVLCNLGDDQSTLINDWDTNDTELDVVDAFVTGGSGGSFGQKMPSKPINVKQVPSHYLRNTPQGRRYKCPICARLFQGTTGFRRHMRTHTGEKRHVCMYCGKESTEGYNHRFHLVICHPFQEYSSSLPPGTTEEELKNTLQFMIDAQKALTTDGRVVYNCTTCSKEMTSHTSLRYHLFVTHFESVLEKLAEVRHLPTPQSLTPHRRYLANPRNVTKSHKSSKSLKHTRKPPPPLIRLPPIVKKSLTKINGRFKCNFCGKLLASYKGLKQHRMTHTNEKPYTCPYCGKGSKCSTSHRDHIIRKHPFEAFSTRKPPGVTDQQLEAAIEFIRSQNFDTPAGKVQGQVFGCPFCPRTFPKVSLFKIHILKLHLEEVVNTLQGNNDSASGGTQATSSSSTSYNHKLPPNLDPLVNEDGDQEDVDINAYGAYEGVEEEEQMNFPTTEDYSSYNETDEPGNGTVGVSPDSNLFIQDPLFD